MRSETASPSERSLRVGIISPYSLSLPGGVQGQVLDLARVLRSRGHEARVLAPCDGPPPDPSVTPLGNSIPTAANGSIAPIAPDVSAQLRTIRALRAEDFDVLHLHEPMVPGPTHTALLVKTAPIVATFHAAGTSAGYRWLGPLLRKAATRIEVRCAVSEDARDMAAATLGGTYEMLFNGVDLTRYEGVEPWPTEEPTVLFLGRHEPRKGLDVLLDAHERLGGGVRLWVAGEGPETDELRARHDRPGISWLGRIDEDEKVARLAGAHVFCAPSVRGESFGIVLVEAMAAGTPVVASDLPGYANVARGGRDALLAAPGDPAQLAARLREALDDDVRRGELVASGSERAAQLSMAELARRYEAIYERVLSR